MASKNGAVLERPKPAEPTIERQMLLANFAASVMTGYYSCGQFNCKTPDQLANLAFVQARYMLAEFDRVVGDGR
jgi:hypothetical protein